MRTGVEFWLGPTGPPSGAEIAVQVPVTDRRGLGPLRVPSGRGLEEPVADHAAALV
jgi:hypothetical protein